ncbi:MAG: hypothetical protein U0838_17490 [Chloroflexota bacterium]
MHLEQLTNGVRTIVAELCGEQLAGTNAMKRRASCILALLLLFVVSGCGLLSPHAPEASTKPQEPYVASTSPAEVNAGECVDPTVSSSAGFACADHAAREDRAPLVPAAPPVDDHRGAAIPGLRLAVRQVGTTSYSTRSPQVDVRIDTVRSLADRPATSRASFVEDSGKWTAASRARADDWARARDQADRAAAAITAFPLDRAGSRSEIAGCIAALSAVMPRAARRIILASDLGQNEEPQHIEDLLQAAVLVIQPCESGDAAECENRRKTWRDLLERRGAAGVQFIRPEQAPVTVPVFLKGT